MECLIPTINIYSVFTEQRLITRVNVIRRVTLTFLFPTVSDPDILILDKPIYLAPTMSARICTTKESAVNTMCVGQPLKTLSDTKVSLLSPDKHMARGPLGKALVGEDCCIQAEGSLRSSSASSVCGLVIRTLPSFRVRESGESFVLSPSTCTQVGQIQT